MTRNQLIEEIMRQVRDVPDLDDQDRSGVLFRLRLSHTAVLREIYATNAVDRAIARAYLVSRSPRAVSGSAARRAIDPPVTQA